MMEYVNNQVENPQQEKCWWANTRIFW